MLNKHLFSEHINSEGWLFTSTYLPRLLYAVEFIPFQGFQTLKKKAREILPVPSFSCKALDRVIYIGDLPYSLVSGVRDLPLYRSPLHPERQCCCFVVILQGVRKEPFTVQIN